jgi:hypothetical protein
VESFIDLIAEETRKFDENPDKNEDTDSLFFLWIIKEAMNSYVVFDDIDTNNVYQFFLFKNSLSGRKLYYGDCEPYGELEEILQKSVFNVPLIVSSDFFIFLFDFFEKVIRRINPSQLCAPPTSGDLDFPVNYRYFKKIIVGMEAGEWNYLDRSGRKIKVLSGTKIDRLDESDLIKPTDGYYVDHTYHYNNGTSAVHPRYVTKQEAIEIHERFIARAKRDIARQKAEYASNLEGMKAQGYPYTDSYDEYIRFLQTNLKNMRFGQFTLNVQRLFNLFIPTPLK